MKRYVEIRPICPFVGKTCIADGWTGNDHFILHPCAFWDGDSCNSASQEEPCRIKRAVNRILSDEEIETNELCVPWETDEKE